MGAGPKYWVDNGLAETLLSRGHDVRVKVIESRSAFPMETVTSFELYRKLAAEIQQDCADGQFPLVLSGNCGAALGTISGLHGLSEKPLGVVWFDAHGDFNTPDTSPTGYLDGMCLATAAGLGWKLMARSLPGFRPLMVDRILHAGGRDFDPEEACLMDEKGVPVVSAQQIHASGARRSLEPALDMLQSQVQDIYLHFDVDVFDPEMAPGNHYAVPGGLHPAQVREAFTMLRERFTICGMGIGSFDPSYDEQGKTLRAVKELVEGLIG
jgi:arginase